MRRVLAAAIGSLLLLTGALTGCSALQGTGDKGFVTGDGTVRLVSAADRDKPVTLAGRDLAGKPLDLARLRGEPVVVVVWGSWCTPCREEAPAVVAAAKQLAGKARFVGINLRNSSTTEARAYERTFQVPYPSFYSPDGRAMLQFPGTLGPNTIPAFVVLDARGRVAASIIGKLPSQQTLVDLVGDVRTQTVDG